MKISWDVLAAIVDIMIFYWLPLAKLLWWQFLKLSNKYIA
jgi:hypothetical protein